MIIQFAIREEPPCDMKGVVRPVSGSSRVMPPMIENTCTANVNASPPGEELAEAVGAGQGGLHATGHDEPVHQHDRHQAHDPDLLGQASGYEVAFVHRRQQGDPCPQPRPNNPPQAKPNCAWMIW